MTKEEFLNGDPFMFKPHLREGCGSTYRYMPDSILSSIQIRIGADRYFYECSVDRVHNDKFQFFGAILNEGVSGEILFSDLHKVDPETL